MEMSHSYKKTPVCKDGNASKKSGKKMANRKIRRFVGLAGKSNCYKKVCESWDICDYRFYEKCKMGMNAEELDRWKKWYLRK